MNDWVSFFAGCCQQACNEAVGFEGRMVEAGVVQQVGSGKRKRVFEAPDVIREYTRFERKLASPAGDTSSEPPARSVPAQSR